MKKKYNLKNKHIYFLILLCFFSIYTKAQSTNKDSLVVEKLTYKQVQSRARDHFVMQFGYMNWQKQPDSIFISGFNNQFKFFGMYDILIKGFPYMSVGLGLGLGWDNVYFNDTKINLSQNSANKISFANNTSKERFEKSKITTFYFEIPAELRFATNPKNYNRAWKFAIGLTYGYLIQANSMGTNLKDANGNILKNSTIQESDSRYFNTFKILAHAKVGWGFFHIFSNYQLNSIFTSTGGPDVNSFAFGIGLNGL